MFCTLTVLTKTERSNMEHAHGNLVGKRWRRQNRREHRRAELIAPVQSMQSGRLGQHTCKDISEGGMRLRSEHGLRAGVRLKIFVPLPIPYKGRNRLHVLEAEVVWSEAGEAGLRFLDAPIENVLDVRQYVKWAA